MQWKVNVPGQDIVVELPDQIPDGKPFKASLGGQEVTLVWHRSTRQLLLWNGSSLVARSLSLRSQTVTKFPGESEVQVNLEYQPHATAPLCPTVTVTPFFPGQEGRGTSARKKDQVIRSQMTGKILKVFVKPGDQMQAGDALLIIEAMKMENKVIAPCAGIVDQLRFKEGETVSLGAELLHLK